MASVTSQLLEEVTAHAQSDSIEDVREICADSTYFPNNLHIIGHTNCKRIQGVLSIKYYKDIKCVCVYIYIYI